MKIGDFIASFIRASFEYGWSVLGKVIHFNIINSKITQFVCLFVMLLISMKFDLDISILQRARFIH